MPGSYLILVNGQQFIRQGLPAVLIKRDGVKAVVVKANPNHDRLGRFAHGSGGDAPDTLRQVEGQIAGGKAERAVALDTSGHILLDKTGGEADVVFTDAEVAQLRDTVITHNHPGESGLNITDVVFAMRGDVRQVRAVTTLYTHSLDRPDSGWPKTQEAHRGVVDAYSRADREQYRVFDAQINSGQITIEDAELEHHHGVMTRFAREMGWTYNRRRRA